MEALKEVLDEMVTVGDLISTIGLARYNPGYHASIIAPLEHLSTREDPLLVPYAWEPTVTDLGEVTTTTCSTPAQPGTTGNELTIAVTQTAVQTIGSSSSTLVTGGNAVELWSGEYTDLNEGTVGIFRFANIAIPNDATITSVDLELTVSNDSVVHNSDDDSRY